MRKFVAAVSLVLCLCVLARAEDAAPTPGASGQAAPFVPIVLDEQKWTALIQALNNIWMPGPVYNQVTTLLYNLEVNAQQEKARKNTAVPKRDP